MCKIKQLSSCISKERERERKLKEKRMKEKKIKEKKEKRFNLKKNLLSQSSELQKNLYLLNLMVRIWVYQCK